MADLLKLYHRLPYPLRVAAASAHGYHLRSWRYGPETERLVDEALERDRWSPERWRAWQEERLAYVLHRAATRVPYYREQWAERRRRGDRASWEELANWPVLAKEAVRQSPLAFVADGCRPGQMYRDRTSGTSGTPLTIYSKRETVRRQYALYEARIRRWHGVSVKERWAILGGQLVVPFRAQRPPFWVRNLGLNQLYLSTHHVSRANARWYADALRRFGPSHMIVYPSSASVLASAIVEDGLEAPTLKVVVSNAELLTDAQRDVIAQAFRCPVRNTYGMGECVAAGSECEEGIMHVWPEVGLLEVLPDPDGGVSGSGRAGRFVATGLLNEDMPLVRYDTGDRGAMGTSARCRCGRSLPAIETLEGRANDLLLTPDGRRVFWLNPVFYGLPVREAQIIQEALDRVRVKYVPAPDSTADTERSIAERFRTRLGDVHVAFEAVREIPRGPNGKFRAVVCELPPDELALVTRRGGGPSGG